MKKKLIFITLLVLFSISLSCNYIHTYALSGEGSIKVILDESELVFDVQPVTVDGRVLVPIRTIFEALGASIQWNDSTSTATCTKGDVKIVLQIDNKYPTVNDRQITLDVPATIVGNRTMVPARFIAESLGASVEWNENANSVIITSARSITFSDKNLETVVRTAIEKPTGEILTTDVKQISTLTASDKKITSLEGIQHLRNLKILHLNNNQISDISPLKSLSNLQSLNLESNRLTDIAPIAALKELISLNLSYNQIVDLAPLSNLEKLEILYLIFNQYHDVNTLKNLKNLTTLNLYGSSVLDITPLKELDKLSKLYLIDPTKALEPDAGVYEIYNQMLLKAKDIVNTVVKPGMNDYDKELAIHDYVVTHVKYDKENVDKNSVPWASHTVYGVLVKGIAVCDGYANIMKALLNLVGIESYVVLGDSLDAQDKTVRHAWNIVKIDGEYYHLDATWDDPTSRNSSSYLYHTFFNLSDKQILATHKFDFEAYPKCKKDSIQYYEFINGYRYEMFTEDYAYKATVNGILKVSLKDGTNTVLTRDKAYNLNYDNGWIYYVNLTDQKIHKIKTDGSGSSVVNDDKAFCLAVVNSKLYYIYITDPDDPTRRAMRIIRVNADGSERSVINTQLLTTYMTPFGGDWIFFRGFDWTTGGKLYRIKLDGSKRKQLNDDTPPGFTQTGNDVSHNVSYYVDVKYECFSGNWIYYINTEDGNKVYKVNIVDLTTVKVNEDDSSNLDIVGDWIYYLNRKEGKYYKMKLDGSLKISLQ